MSRLHHTNNDLLLNCESYLTRMLRTTKKVDRSRNAGGNEPRTVRPPCVANPQLVPRPVVKQSLPPQAERPRNAGGIEPRAVRSPCVTSQPPVAKQPPQLQVTTVAKKEQSTQELLHKEIFNNNMATVEVTVRTVSQQQEKREPWSKLLANRKSSEHVPGSFSHFDPLRTLHFLTKELQIKLKAITPVYPGVQQILNDLQTAVQRLPPEVISQLNLSEESSGDSAVHNPEKKEITTTCRQTQTVVIGDNETRLLQQQLEESASKLEASCKEMEIVCATLRDERDSFQRQLAVEQETVKAMKKEFDDCVSEKDGKAVMEIKNLKCERDDLRLQLSQLQGTMDAHIDTSAHEYRAQMQALRSKQLSSEQELGTVRNDLTIAKLERDKLAVLLECRDKQLRELRAELEGIQALVSTQLFELKGKPTMSPVSSLSSISQVWEVPSSRTQKLGNSIHELFLNNGARSGRTLQPMYSEVSSLQNDDNRSNFELLPLEGHVTESDATLVSTLTNQQQQQQQDYMPKMSHSSIKEMFAEIKRQAFQTTDVTLPAPPAPQHYPDFETT